MRRPDAFDLGGGYGYAGVKFLAKGIPVIANALGEMPEYTRPRVTGWLNRSCSNSIFDGSLLRRAPSRSCAAGHAHARNSR